MILLFPRHSLMRIKKNFHSTIHTTVSDSTITWLRYNGALLLTDPTGRSIPSDQQVIRRDARRQVLRQRVLFARWTSDYDAFEQSQWWYCLRDKPISLDALDTKQRYRIRQGLKNADYVRIMPGDDILISQMWDVACASFAKYPAKYRPHLEKESFFATIKEQMSQMECWGCVEKSENRLVGYAFCMLIGDIVSLQVVKVDPDYLKKEINAGLAFTLCDEYLNKRHFYCVSDGERNIRHETQYQQFLCRVLGFRFSYCRLNVVYHPLVGVAVACLYPFRSLIGKLGEKSPLIYNLYSLLRQEEIARSFKS